MPCPFAAYWSASSTFLPSPPAPISEAITTMDRHIRIVWLTPAMIEGIASGISTSRSSMPLVQPKASAASLVPSGTCRMPSAVSRMTGGMPNTTVASTPGGFPVPKNAMIGMRYTKAGIVCMKSSTGRAI